MFLRFAGTVCRKVNFLWLGLVSIVFVVSACSKSKNANDDLVGSQCVMGESDAQQEMSGIVNGKTLAANNPVSSRLVGILFENTKGQMQICSGALLENNVVLTAAHCALQKPENIKIVFHNNINCLGAQNKDHYLRSVTHVIRHPDYHDYDSIRWKMNYDLALLKYEGSTPSSHSFFREFYSLSSREDKKIIFSGYGDVRSNSATSGVLNITTASAAKQLSKYNKNIWQLDQKLTGVCQGDSGGPMIVNDQGELKIAGVTSAVSNRLGNGEEMCNDIAYFVNTDAHQSWLQEAYSEITRY